MIIEYLMFVQNYNLLRTRSLEVNVSNEASVHIHEVYVLSLKIVGNLENEKINLASFMKHGIDVQDAYYNRVQQKPKDARMSNIIDKVVSGERLTEEDMAHQVQSAYFFIHF